MVRRTVLSYLDSYLRRGEATMFAYRHGLRNVRWSYERLVTTANRFARELEARGVRPTERVLLCGENSPEWAAAFWGCLLRGAVVVPLDVESTPSFIRSVQQQTEAKLMIRGGDAVSAAASGLGLPELRLGELSERVAHHSPAAYIEREINEETLAEIIYTSGTTSTPRGVMLTHRNLLANLLPLEEEIKKYIRWERLVHPIRFLSLVPLSHVFGQFMGLFVPQLVNGEVHFQESLNPSEIIRRARSNNISVIVLVPRMLDALREWVERDYAAIGKSEDVRERLASAKGTNFLRRWWVFRRVHSHFGWKFWAFISGGATLDERTETFWRRMGFAVLQGYGMTETASLISVTHPFKQSRGAVGRLMPGYEVRLDETGEIVVRGESVSPGYWADKEGGTRNEGGWLHTGDIGELDESGNLYFKGRKKEVIVTAAGLNIYPEDIEAALNSQPEVRASCVVKWEGGRGAEPLAVLILRNPGASAEAAVARANSALSEHQRLRNWFIWEEPDFPRTSTHKVLRREVSALVCEKMRTESIAQETETTGREEQGSTRPSLLIIREAARISGHASPVKVEPSANLTTDLKLDSLGRVELLSVLEEHYGMEIDEGAFTAATTLGDLENLLHGEAEGVGTPYPYPNWPRRFPLPLIRTLLFYLLVLPITLVMSRMRVVGRRHLEGLSGSALFVANHVTVADHALVLAALPRRLRRRLAIAMEGERLRDWRYPPKGTSLFARLRSRAEYVLVNTFFHVFPLPRRSGFRRSFAYAGECIDRGESVLVFPEGARAPRGQMQMSPLKSGIGLLAKELGVEIVPVKLRGLYELKQSGQYFAPPGAVSVVFGRPVKPDTGAEPAEITEELERLLNAL